MKFMRDKKREETSVIKKRKKTRKNVEKTRKNVEKREKTSKNG